MEWFVLLLDVCLLLLLPIHKVIAAGVKTCNTGSFTVVWNTDDQGSIEVLQNNKSTVWFTNANSPVVSAIKGQDSVNQNGGDYVIHSKIIDECNKLQFNEMKIVLTNTTPKIVLSGDLLCESNHDGFTVIFQSLLTEENYEHLFINITLHTEYYNKLKVTYGCEASEQFYGLGVQYTHFNLRGHHIPLFISEQGVGRGVEPLTFVLDKLSPGAG